LTDEVEHDVLGDATADQRAVGRISGGEPLLACVLPPDDERVVELQGLMIG
jgi:hypothetical protein